MRLALGAEEVAGNPNVPLYAYHRPAVGPARRFTYVQSRAFYCCWYEHLAYHCAAFHRLVAWREQAGVSLVLRGYDGHPLSADLYADYVDGSKPFGHERVLACMILLHATRGELPWRRYMREHTALYAGFNLPAPAWVAARPAVIEIVDLS